MLAPPQPQLLMRTIFRHFSLHTLLRFVMRLKGRQSIADPKTTSVLGSCSYVFHVSEHLNVRYYRHRPRSFVTIIQRLSTNPPYEHTLHTYSCNSSCQFSRSSTWTQTAMLHSGHYHRASPSITNHANSMKFYEYQPYIPSCVCCYSTRTLVHSAYFTALIQSAFLLRNAAKFDLREAKNREYSDLCSQSGCQIEHSSK